MPKSKEIKEENKQNATSQSDQMDNTLENAMDEDEVSQETVKENSDEPIKDSEEEDSDLGSADDSLQDQNKSSDGDEEDPKYKSLNEKHLRLYAEFDNFRKRSAKEALDIIQTANGNLITQLIPTLEHFEMAFAPDQKAKKLEDFESGIRMIFNGLKDVLTDVGLEEINPEGEEFDPMFHEAMLEQYHETIEEGNVVQVYQKGYKLKSKILKHAKVITSKGKKEDEN